MRKIKILHLSDIHIGYDLKDKVKHQLWSDGTGKINNRTQLLEAHSQLPELLEDRLKTQNQSPDFILVSGDFVLNGEKQEEHEKAFKVFLKFCKKLNFTRRDRIFIVPGNHDVDRKAVNNLIEDSEHSDGGKIMKFHKESANKFYENDYFSDGDYNSIELKYLDTFYGPSETQNKNYVNKKGKTVYNFQRFELSIIPLQSQHATPLDATDDKWPKDKGFIEGDQIRDVEKENLDQTVNIAIFHHNPIPLKRRFNYNYALQPEYNYLANGPELLYDLSRFGVNIILHGHRHQQSIFSIKDINGSESAECIVIGAPSCGHEEMGSEYLGYNFLEIDSINGDLELTINSEKYLKKRVWDAPIVSKITLKKREGKNVETFLSFDEGVRKLAELMEGKVVGVSMLHYYYESKWKDSLADYWGGIISEETTLEAFCEVARVNITNVTDVIRETITKGYFSDGLVSKLSEYKFLDAFLSNLNKREYAKNKYFEYHHTWCKKYPRQANYILEVIKCNLDKNFWVRKSIYFSRDKKTKTKNKFEWLVNSIIAAKSPHKNFNFSWLPFEIKGLKEESLVCIHLNLSDDYNKTAFLFGYSQEGNDTKSVLFVDPEINHLNTEGGAVHVNLRAIMKKIINPLTIYVENNFPLFVKGTLHINNLKDISMIYGIGDETWNEYEKKLREKYSNKIDSNNAITLEKLKSLYLWIANLRDSKRISTTKGIHLPWNVMDYNYLKRRVKLIINKR